MDRMTRSIQSAFTLIELLVVVAIIAILASIGIMNFLEAQTRSKVSRTKADIRTMATAVEAYTVDHSRHPDTFGTIKVTTPIAYISTLPGDVFAHTGGSPHFAYMNCRQMSTAEELDNWDVTNYTPAQQGVLAGHTWFIWSNGPDLKNTSLEDTQSAFNDVVDASGADYGIFYDPTNGTVSRGDVIRGHRMVN